MEQLIRNKFLGKSTVLLGFGREGQSTYQLLRKVLPGQRLTIADVNDQARDNPLIINDSNLDFITGGDYLTRLADFEVIVRSPGIPVWQIMAGPGKPAEKGLIPYDRITSQTDLFLQKYGAQAIGITGTKGKSTTSSLIHHILKTAGYDALLMGNIGNPVFHFTDVITPETVIVVELSSHQLEFLTVAPSVAVFLNLFQEHLDAYASYADYQLAKLNIVKMQPDSGNTIYNADDPLVSGLVEPLLANKNGLPYSLVHQPVNGSFVRDGGIFFSDGLNEIPVWHIHQDRFLRGEHNLKNIMAAINVAMVLGVEVEMIGEGIETFKGLEHRLEYVGEYGNIHFYNDSIATIPEACMEAVKAIPGVDTLVAGGFDRGIDYAQLGRFLAGSQVRNIILVGEAGKRIGDEIRRNSGLKKLYYITRFDDFKPIAFAETLPGHVCLLSPAAASYDEFRNFEERGKRYRELVRQHV